MSGPRGGHHDEPSTVVKEGTPPLGDEVLAFVVDVVDGPDKGTRFAFDSTRPSGVLVGQSSACDVRLTDRQVSRRHVELDVTDKGLRVTDLDSTNGTFVTGVRIHEAYLVGGEVVRLGQTALRIVRALSSARAETPAVRSFGGFIGESPEMRRLYPLCDRLAKSDVPVVIEGETGTGKEVLAEALHQASARASAQFVVFDCTAVPPSLLESALFGHERGAFTGALSQRRGVFEQAHGGTLFLDEIGDLDLALQPKLLRAIERGEVQRVGANQWLRVDVRIIAATRRDLDREVQAGRFRDDLFFRLAVGRIELPPLRRRRGDVAVLARHFWHSIAGADRPIPAGLVERLEDYPWPGNVRELQNAIARHVAVGELPTIGTSIPPPGLEDGDVVERVLAKGLPLPLARAEVVDEFERRYVERVLEQHGGNVSKAAAASGIALRYFQLIKARRTK
ncbi:MAG TPA: sigma 54-interacting transcriptional regulator [Polyangiaceae bacterium]|nr:sigma 54-interacting transcriptional regulator [Polyangiaceae bacterium]